MPELTNKEIEKVFEGPSGKNDYGPWQIYNLYFVGGKKKFGYMWSDKKPVPVPGSKVVYFKFNIEKKEKDGKIYENYAIKEIKFAEDSPLGSHDNLPPEAQNEPSVQNSSHPYINHGECLIKLMEMAGGASCDVGVLETLIEVFKSGINQMITGEEKEPDNNTRKDPPPPGDDDIPF